MVQCFSYMKKNNGFTLIELLISISIIAILSVILSISFSNAQKQGRDQRRISDMKAIQNAAEQYYLLNGGYPSLASYTAGVKWSVGTQSILESYPKDPKNTGAYVYTRRNISSSAYCVCAVLEKGGIGKGNSMDTTCSDFINPNGYFCVKNQQ